MAEAKGPTRPAGHGRGAPSVLPRLAAVTLASLLGASVTVSLLVSLVTLLWEGAPLTPLMALEVALLSLAGMVTSHLSIVGVSSLLLAAARGGRDGP